jgi:tetratricopeptide (TPR) repeat protein
MTGGRWPFVARQDEQERFAAALVQTRMDTAVDAPSRIVLIEALGGYGKTTLTKRFGAIARGHFGHPLVADPQFRVVEIDWEEQRDRHPEFSVAFGPRLLPVLLTLHGALLDSARRGSEVQSDVVRAFRSFTEHALRAPEFAALAERTAADRVEAVSNRAQRLDAVAALGTTVTAASPFAPAAATINPLLKLVKSRRSSSSAAVDDVDEAFRFEEALVRFFADGLRVMSKKTPVVLLLDTYEIVAALGPWLRQIARHSGGRVLWVFAGRLQGHGPGDDSSDAAAFRREVPEGYLRVISLPKFGEDTTRRLLSENSLESLPAELIAAAAEITRGIPLAIQLVARVLDHGGNPDEVLRPLTKQGTSGYVVRELAHRYLVHVRDDTALAADLPLLYGLALLHGDRSDPAILEALWNRPEPTSQVLEQLARRHDFVQTETQRLHQEIGATLREYLLDSARRSEIRAPNERARTVLLARLHARMAEAADVLLDTRSRSDVLALVWHAFWVDDDEGFRTLAEVLPLALVFEPEVARELLQMASFFNSGFTERHERLMRGFASMLTFGTFVDSWLARRSSIPGLGSSTSYLGRMRDKAQQQDRVYAEEALIAAGEEKSELGLRAPTKRSIVTILLSSSNEDPVAWLSRLEEARSAWPTGGGTGSAFSAAATTLRLRLLELDAPAELLRRAAVVDKDAEAAPGSGRVLARLASALIDLGDEMAATRVLERIGETDADNAVGLAGYAEMLHRDDKLQAAILMYERAIRADPDNVLIINSYARALWTVNRLQEALEVLERGIRAEPASASLLADYTVILREVGRYDEAASAFDRTIAAEPTEANLLGNLAMYLDEVGRLNDARAMFERALEADPTHANNLIIYAFMLRKAGSPEDADRLCDRAVQAQPTRAGELGNLAIYMDEAGRLDDAEAMYARAIEKNPAHPNNLTCYAAFLAGRGRADDRFLQTANAALELSGDSTENRVILHFCLWACGPVESRTTHELATNDLLHAGTRTIWSGAPRVIDVAARTDHPDIEALRAVAAKMAGPQGPST